MFSSWVADAYGSNKTAFWSNYFSNLPPTSRVFFYDTPEIAVYIKNRNYYQYLAPAGGNIGQDQLSVIASDSIDLIIIKTVALESLYLSNDFSGYSIEQRSYKYTILNRVSR